jgi:hypothetical protein
MSRTHRSDTAYVPGFHHSGDRGLGVRGADVPSTGEHGPAINFSGISLPAEANDEFSLVILSAPVGVSNFFVEEDGSATGTAPPGTYTGTWEGFKNGVSYGTGTFTVSFGDGLTGTLVFDDILASGQIDGAPVTAPSLGRAVAPRVGLTADGKLIILF